MGRGRLLSRDIMDDQLRNYGKPGDFLRTFWIVGQWKRNLWKWWRHRELYHRIQLTWIHRVPGPGGDQLSGPASKLNRLLQQPGTADRTRFLSRQCNGDVQRCAMGLFGDGQSQCRPTVCERYKLPVGGWVALH